MGLRDYLKSSAGALKRLKDFPLVHMVVGNESCDLDSAVSAITFAYYLHLTSKAPKGKTLFLPLLNIPRSDFPLHTEVTYFLGKFDITAADLAFQDDLDLARVKVSADLKVTLVDHHVLSVVLSEAGLEDRVVRILDHHVKDGDLPDKCDSTLELVGSCATLVAEAVMADKAFSMDVATATLLYGTILTDTIYFSEAAGKTTAKDVGVAERLRLVVGSSVDGNAMYRDINTAKCDVSGLTNSQMLRKDLKIAKGENCVVALSSVAMDLTTLMSRAGFVDDLKTFAAEKKADAVVVLTVCYHDDDNITRQLAVFSPTKVLRQQMADVLNQSQTTNLGLSPLPCHHEELLPFTQSNVAASRKQVLPIVKEFLTRGNTRSS